MRHPSNLLLLSRYDRRGPSSRMRLMQFIPLLEEAGFSVVTDSLFDAEYLDALYARKRNPGAILRAYWRRLACLREARNIDLIWLQKEALPWFPATAERLLLPKGVPLVVDFDDAVFHRYDQHPSPVVRGLLGQKIARVMERADLVLAGNDYIGAYATNAGARNVQIVPTVVDTEAYDARPRTPPSETVTIGWVGTPGTWRGCVAPFLPDILETLRVLSARILAVGAGEAVSEDLLLNVKPWSEDSEAIDMRDMDVGIMPLPDTPWMRGKCGYKLIQYMASGLPVVASPVGVNTEIVDHGVNGFLANTADEWRSALETLIGDPELRRRMGRAGREKVERKFSLEVQGPRVIGHLTGLARQ